MTHPDVERAYGACLRLARAHYENFPVASRLVPAALRPHVAAVYAFARVADDYADEGVVPQAMRELRLANWRARLHAAARDGASPDGPYPEIFLALADTIRTCRVPVGLLDDLLSAFAQDVRVKRYDTWAAVMDYCRRSANPVGRIVLRIAGYHDTDLDRASDSVCTALQLANFWQDFAIDVARGRIYVPAEVYTRHGASERALDTSALSAEWRAALRECCGRTRDLFERGRAVCDGVTGRLRYELRLTWLGGTRILERVEAVDFDVARHRPSLGAADVPALAWRALRWRTAS